ncbi:MAG: pilus assembly protein TadG-related protein [Acidimicrobiales bacterium]
MQPDDDRGAVTAFAIVFTVTVIFVFGLVWDGGRLLAAQRQADNQAASAARAAAQAIDIDALRNGQTTNLLDFNLAQQNVCSYAATIGRGCGEFGLSATRGGTAVTVTLEIPVTFIVIPGASRTARGEGTACTEIGLNDPIVACI